MKKLLLPAFMLSFLFSLNSQTVASINRFYKREIIERPNVIPAWSGLYYEEVYRSGTSKRPKKDDRVIVNIKSYQINGTNLLEKKHTLNLANLEQSNAVQLKQGIRMMRIGDKYRFYTTPKLGYDPELQLQAPVSLMKVYEVELVDILNEKGDSRFPEETGYYLPVKEDPFDTVPIYLTAKRKARVRAEGQ